ncbi:MAG: M42 family metallopeptidase [Lentisphaeria bacterium]|jgi:endoglucanase|nr:M42 family metallopeptidase [Lentisphaeria bacterium]
MKRQAVALLKRLTEAHGAPGDEGTVRDIVAAKLAGTPTFDRTGSIIHEYSGSSKTPRVMIEAHMDEVGFVVRAITREGFLRFIPAGGWWGHTLLAQRVRVRTSAGRELIGIIAAKPPHLLSPGERDKVLKPDQMYIDIGAANRDAVARLGVAIGDTIVPDTLFTHLAHTSRYAAKAFDNRVGVGMLIQATQALQKHKHPNTLVAVGATQEEVGIRGARTATRLADPDVAIVLEGPPADDLPGSIADENQGVLGKGVQIRMMDPTAISNRRLVNFVVQAAVAAKIPHQLAVRRSGGTDAKEIHLHGIGVPTIVIGVPARYIHTHNSIIDINDYLAGIKLVTELVRKLDKKTAASFVKF